MTDTETKKSISFEDFRSEVLRDYKIAITSRECSLLGRREVLTGWRELLNYVKAEGTRDAQIQRYKGLGEMNAEQLWETTMNPDKRTLLQVRLEDLVECEEIFSTLMGDDVESRRKFIETNALDVRNLDV